jgi:hypothetical protein
MTDAPLYSFLSVPGFLDKGGIHFGARTLAVRLLLKLPPVQAALDALVYDKAHAEAAFDLTNKTAIWRSAGCGPAVTSRCTPLSWPTTTPPRIPRSSRVGTALRTRGNGRARTEDGVDRSDLSHRNRIGRNALARFSTDAGAFPAPPLCVRGVLGGTFATRLPSSGWGDWK